MLQKLNSPFMYALCGSIVAVVALICIVFMIRAYRAGKKIGMDTAKMKRTIIASATFSVLPSVAILLGVIALSGDALAVAEAFRGRRAALRSPGCGSGFGGNGCRSAVDREHDPLDLQHHRAFNERVHYVGYGAVHFQL